jgi:hypothetical protein
MNTESYIITRDGETTLFSGISWLMKALNKQEVPCLHVLEGGRAATTNADMAHMMHGVELAQGSYRIVKGSGAISLTKLEEMQLPSFDKVFAPPAEKHRICQEKKFVKNDFFLYVITETKKRFNIDYLDAAFRAEHMDVFLNSRGMLTLQYRDPGEDIRFTAAIMALKDRGE